MRLASVQGVSTQLSCTNLSGSSRRKPPTKNAFRREHERCEECENRYHRMKRYHTNLEVSWKHVLKFTFLPAPALLCLFLTLSWFRIHNVICVRMRSYTFIVMEYSLISVLLFYGVPIITQGHFKSTITNLHQLFSLLAGHLM